MGFYSQVTEDESVRLTNGSGQLFELFYSFRAIPSMSYSVESLRQKLLNRLYLAEGLGKFGDTWDELEIAASDRKVWTECLSSLSL